MDQNEFTTTIRTKPTKNNDFGILFGKETDSVGISSYMVQYLTHGMFIYYIYQKKMGVCQKYFCGESITAQGIHPQIYNWVFVARFLFPFTGFSKHIKYKLFLVCVLLVVMSKIFLFFLYFTLIILFHTHINIIKIKI